MQLNFTIIFEYILWISLLLPALIFLKVMILFTLLQFENTKRISLKAALSLFQLGEFGEKNWQEMYVSKSGVTAHLLLDVLTDFSFITSEMKARVLGVVESEK